MIPYLDTNPARVLEMESDEVLDLGRDVSSDYVSELESRGENMLLDPSLLTETDRYFQAMAYLAARDKKPSIEEMAVKTSTNNVVGLESKVARPAFDERYSMAREDLLIANSLEHRKSFDSEETEG